MSIRTGFDVFDVSLDLVRALVPLLARLRKRDAELEKQLRKALQSVPQNIREGNRRDGKDQTHLWRVAAGSADEVVACLLTAEAFGYLQRRDIEDPVELADRVLAMLYRLTS